MKMKLSGVVISMLAFCVVANAGWDWRNLDFRWHKSKYDPEALKPYFYETEEVGRFVGSLQLEMLTDKKKKREAKLLSDYSFIDFNSMKWDVPEGTVVDGASIPQVLWSAVGSPWGDSYRNASVIHDYYCDKKSAPWQNVHRMFYEGCLANGINKAKAMELYAAVYCFGPRWEVKTEKSFSLIGPDESVAYVYEMTPKFDEDKLTAISKWIQDNDPSIEELQQELEKQQ